MSERRRSRHLLHIPACQTVGLWPRSYSCSPITFHRLVAWLRPLLIDQPVSARARSPVSYGNGGGPFHYLFRHAQTVDLRRFSGCNGINGSTAKETKFGWYFE